MRVFLVRCGSHYCDEDTYDTPLTREGILESIKLANMFKEISFQRKLLLIMSPLNRATTMAQKIIDVCTPTVDDFYVKESYLIRDKIQSKNDLLGTPENMSETPAQFNYRVKLFNEQIKAYSIIQDWDDMVVITHGAVIKELCGKEIASGEHILYEPRM
jgi:broad specificity phosphatase PhoE